LQRDWERDSGTHWRGTTWYDDVDVVAVGLGAGQRDALAWYDADGIVLAALPASRQTKRRPVFVGKRLLSSGAGDDADYWDGKRRGPMFVGKRHNPVFVG